MCSASTRPTITSASKIIMQQGAGVKPFFAGVGPRALSNGLNSAVFFCFFEALRGVGHLVTYLFPPGCHSQKTPAVQGALKGDVHMYVELELPLMSPPMVIRRSWVTLRLYVVACR